MMLDVVREAEVANTMEMLPHALDRDEFLRAMYPRLVGSLGLQGFSVEEAEDLAQDVLVQAVRHWDKVTAATSPEGWLFRTASNLSRSWLRRLRVARRKTSPLLTPVEADAADAVAVRDAVARLPVRQREAVVFRYFGQLSVRETAEAMGCAEGTVRALTSQGLAALRTHFDIDDSETTRD
jgi:RNA polymerase sigma factor (sigma-70 family)